MRKPGSLREAIGAALPDVQRDPDRLRMYVDKGAIQARLGPERGFSYGYTLTLLLIDFTADTSLLAIAIIDWLRVEQPDLLTPGKQIDFEADILDNKAVDLELNLQLDEMVKVTPKEGGGYDIEYLAEPNPLFDDDALLADGFNSAWTDGGEKIVPNEQPFGADVQPPGVAP